MLFILYAVIWGLFVPVSAGEGADEAAEEAPVAIEETILSMDDPFDVSKQAPQLVQFFLNGLAEIKKQLELKNKPEEKKPELVEAQPVAGVPKRPEPQELPKPKKLQIPEMKVTGVIYNTDRPQAIINGKVVGVGGVVDGVSILKIQKDSIHARFENSDIILKLNKE